MAIGMVVMILVPVVSVILDRSASSTLRSSLRQTITPSILVTVLISPVVTGIVKLVRVIDMDSEAGLMSHESDSRMVRHHIVSLRLLLALFLQLNLYPS